MKFRKILRACIYTRSKFRFFNTGLALPKVYANPCHLSLIANSDPLPCLWSPSQSLLQMSLMRGQLAKSDYIPCSKFTGPGLDRHLSRRANQISLWEFGLEHRDFSWRFEQGHFHSGYIILGLEKLIVWREKKKRNNETYTPLEAEKYVYPRGLWYTLIQKVLLYLNYFQWVSINCNQIIIHPNI